MKTILIVDDEFGIADALNDVLADEGYQVFLARNGADGLRRMKEVRPDLVLCDLMMPVMDGEGMLAAMRANPDFKDIPFIMMSAVAQGVERKLDYQVFLRKPFNINSLLGIVERLIGRP